MADKITEKPCIIQNDCTLLLEVGHPLYREVRDKVNRFAELIKSPDRIHTYRITPLSVWNACSAGFSVDEIIHTLNIYSKYGVPQEVTASLRDSFSRFGKVRIFGKNRFLVLSFADESVAKKLLDVPKVADCLIGHVSGFDYQLKREMRGTIKQVCIKEGYPVHDLAGYGIGDPLPFSLRKTTGRGRAFVLREYQQGAATAFYQAGSVHGGAGVVVLPCGAGKTVVGITCMQMVQTATLVLSSCVTSLHQWRSEILDKTTLAEDQVSVYAGANKEIRPVTIASYQMLSYRDSRDAELKHLELFMEQNWGLIIYDEVHLLPAPVFQVTAGIQAKRRLGLTATLVREDGREDEVFALVGPKKFDLPWKDLEAQGWIAKALCTEIRLPLTEKNKSLYAESDKLVKFRIASENPLKLKLIRSLMKKHAGDQILIIGLYIKQLLKIAIPLGIPLLTGKTDHKTREEIYKDFKQKKITVLAVSKIANFAIDLPDASVAIQVSGTYGSRQEEAQRLGRVLRAKEGANQAFFYSLVSGDTREQHFAFMRQRFLCEQGYDYRIVTDYRSFLEGSDISGTDIPGNQPAEETDMLTHPAPP